MKIYRSLVYREMKLTRKHNLLMMILFAVMEGFMLFPVFMMAEDELTEAERSEQMIVMVALSMLVSAIGGFAAGMNNGIHKADIDSGWKRYSFALPATAKQQAFSDVMTKLAVAVTIGVLTAVYTVFVKIFTDRSVFLHTMNLYMIVTAAAMLFDTVYCGIIMIAREKNELKKFSLIASASGLILLHFLPDLEMFSQEGISKKLARTVEVIGSWKLTVIAAAALIEMYGVYYAVLRRSYERREP